MQAMATMIEAKVGQALDFEGLVENRVPGRFDLDSVPSCLNHKVRNTGPGNPPFSSDAGTCATAAGDPARVCSGAHTEADEVEALWERYRRSPSDTAVEQALVMHYLPLVKSVLGRMTMCLPPHVDAGDLYSAGMLGLLQAIRNYDPRCGSSFGNYARWRIKGAVLDELRKLDWMPRSVHAKSRKVQEAMLRVERQTGRMATEAELAAELGITSAQLQQWLDEIRPAAFVSLDAAIESEQGDTTSLHEAIEDESQASPFQDAARAELVGLVAGLIRRLPPAHQKVLALYYFEGLRLREIAELLGVTESRVCQIHTQAILKLKAELAARGISAETD